MKRVFLTFSLFSLLQTEFLAAPPPPENYPSNFVRTCLLLQLLHAVMSAFCSFTLLEYLVPYSWLVTAEPCILFYRA